MSSSNLHDVVMTCDNELEALRLLFADEVTKAQEAASVEDINMSGFRFNCLLDRIECELRAKGKALESLSEE